MFGARASALSFNQTLWVYTSEVLQTDARAFGVGLATSFARIGGIVAPLFAVYLHDKYPVTCIVSIAAACGLSAIIAALCLRIEPKGLELK